MYTPEEQTVKQTDYDRTDRPRKPSAIKRFVSYSLLLTLGALIMLVAAYYSQYSRLPLGIGGTKASTSRGDMMPVDEHSPAVAMASSSVNIIVYGVDLGLEGAPRADTIILFSIDLEDRSIHAVSIPRDTRMNIPGQNRMERINAAYALGGPSLLVRSVEQLLALPIDYYVGLDFDGFESVINTLGGVTIDVERRMWYRDDAQSLLIDLQPGVQRLDGEQALQYVRYRGDGFGDVTALDNGNEAYGGRVNRQLKLVRAVFRQAFSVEHLLQLPKVMTGLFRAVATNMPPDVGFQLAMRLKDTEVERIQTFVLPGVSDTIGGASYWIHDVGKTKELVYKTILRQPMVKAAVLNGNGVSGVAGAVANRLRDIGYEIVSIANADRFDYDDTMVMASEESIDYARTVADALGGRAQAVVNEHVTAQYNAQVVVIVGKDIVRL